jgi:hypothetical protein
LQPRPPVVGHVMIILTMLSQRIREAGQLDGYFGVWRDWPWINAPPGRTVTP